MSSFYDPKPPRWRQQILFAVLVAAFLVGLVLPWAVVKAA